MSALDFITLWRAVPFAPFRVFTHDGRVVDVASVHQAAASPDLKLFTVVVSSDHGEVIPADQIARCERLPPVPAAKPATLQPRAALPPEVAAAFANLPAEAAAMVALAHHQVTVERGRPQVAFLASTLTDGVRIISAAVHSSAGRPCFTTAGTRWSTHALEIFENGCSLYLDHPDDPSLVQRVICWPPQNGTFDTFSEAQPFDDLIAELRARDQKLRASSREPIPALSYWERIKPLPRPKVELPELDPREEETDDDICGPVRLVVEPHMVARETEVNCPRLETIRLRHSVFDLTGTSWDADITRGDLVTFTLRHWPDAARTLTVRPDPLADVAHLPDLKVTQPLAFVERALRNFSLHGSWERLTAALAAGPLPKDQPDLRIPVPGGKYTVELWPGPSREGTPFLHPRIVETAGPRDGRAILDLRGTGWGARIHTWDEEHRLQLRLIHEQPRNRWSLLGYPLVLDLPSRRITSPNLPGSTAMSVLQKGAPDWFNPTVMADNLKESLTRGLHIPLP